VTHHDGFGQNFQDCMPPNDWTTSLALEAAQAWATANGGSPTQVQCVYISGSETLWSVTSTSQNEVAYWAYTGSGSVNYAGLAYLVPGTVNCPSALGTPNGNWG
jgi:hypothetical protein